MPLTVKALSRGSFATSNATLYTVPSATTSVVTNILVCNTDEADQTFTMLLDGVEIFSTTTLNAKGTIAIDLKQALATTKVVSGSASSTNVKYHISGTEIS